MSDDGNQVPEHLITVVDTARAKMAVDLRVLDVTAITPFADYFVIAGGNSARQVQAIATAVLDKLRGMGHRADHVEGLTVGEWVLIDCADVIVHVFTNEKRKVIDLERLWRDANIIEVREAAA